MINCLIVDDEKPARDELSYLVKNYDFINNIYQASNGFEALNILSKLKIDLLFLDIKMPEISGMDIAEKVQKMSHKPLIVFVTAYDDYAIKAFKVNAIDYLLKPIDTEQLKETMDNKIREYLKRDGNQLENLENLINYMSQNNKNSLDKITVFKENKMIPLSFSDIYYITIQSKETIIFTKNNKFYSNFTLGELEDRLDNNTFFRCHKSFIVNIDKIESIEPWFNYTLNLKLKDREEKVPVSRSNVKKFKELLNIS